MRVKNCTQMQSLLDPYWIAFSKKGLILINKLLFYRARFLSKMKENYRVDIKIKH